MPKTLLKNANVRPDRIFMLFVASLCAAAPALAQADRPASGSVFDGDWVTLGIGAALSPSYSGSDDYVLSPAPLITGSVAGIDFRPRAAGLELDLVPDSNNARIGIIGGFGINGNFDRTSRIKDPVVSLLGQLDTAIEVGPVAGVQVNRLLNPFDSLSAEVALGFDVAGAHDGGVVSPSLTYFTPVSRSAVVTLAVSADWIDDKYAGYYYNVSPAGSAASGLPVFSAKGGWKSASATLLSVYDLDGNVTNGGFSLFAIGNYSRLLGDAKRSPITSIRGSADQWFGAVGVGYTF
ncbi:MAG: MipA/OmpV family protein [Parasphingorhabdus sp.]|nr:MipA/OmpV family protein [Parasphingorhabdus sp.]